MTVQLSPAQEQRLARLVAHSGRNAEDILRDRIERFLTEEEGLMLAAQQGREDIAAGRFVEHQEVVDRIERLLAGR